jgi:hypothetical protein
MRAAARINSFPVTVPFSQGLAKRAVVMACAISAALPGCTLLGRRVRECEGFDVPLSVFVGPSRKELRTRVLGSGIDETFPFVAEANAEQMVIVGFTPLGTKSFTLTRKADQVEIDNIVGARQKVSPRNVMADVLAMSLPSACATAPDGDAPSNYDSWKVVDTCSNNLPLRRTISKAAAEAGQTPAVEVEIEYRPEAIIVRQKQCKYTAAYVLQVSAPIPGLDVKKSDDAAEAAEAATPPATTPVAAPPPATPPPSVSPAPATPPAAPAAPPSAAPAPKTPPSTATPAAPGATLSAPAATPPAAAPPPAKKPAPMLVPSPAGSPILVPAN